MSAQASIITQTKDNVLLVPTSSVQTQNGVSTVSVLTGEVAEQKTVETGLTSGTQTEIISGLSEGDAVITNSLTKTTSKTSGQTTSPFSGLGGGMGGATVVRMSR
jgi:multidrug efflux pump subunit AcrA (membrane-fusion protein)